jgi:hypothetical protein
MLNNEQQNLEYTEFVSELMKIGINVTEFVSDTQLFNAPAGLNEDTGNAFTCGLVMHCNTVLKLARRLAKTVSLTFTIDDESLVKVCLLHQIAKTEMFEPNDDQYGIKRGYLYKFANTEGLLKVGERSLCMCANAGIKFTPIEFEAMRVLDKDGDELKTQKYKLNILSLIILQANELAYAIEKEKFSKN